MGSHVFTSSGGFSNGVNDVMVVMVGFFSLVNIDFVSVSSIFSVFVKYFLL